jgi:hypothetical protein
MTVYNHRDFVTVRHEDRVVTVTIVHREGSLGHREVLIRLIAARLARHFRTAE